MEATVEWNVEQVGTARIPGATRVILQACVEDHLGDKLVGGKPRGAGAHAGKKLAEATVCDVGAHVGVHVQLVAIVEKANVKLRRQ